MHTHTQAKLAAALLAVLVVTGCSVTPRMRVIDVGGEVAVVDNVEAGELEVLTGSDAAAQGAMAGGGAGLATGAMAGLTCGPFAPACVPVAGLSLAAIGANRCGCHESGRGGRGGGPRTTESLPCRGRPGPGFPSTAGRAAQPSLDSGQRIDQRARRCLDRRRHPRRSEWSNQAGPASRSLCGVLPGLSQFAKGRCSFRARQPRNSGQRLDRQRRWFC